MRGVYKLSRENALLKKENAFLKRTIDSLKKKCENNMSSVEYAGHLRKTNWTTREQNVIKSVVLLYIEQGKNVSDALRTLSVSLGRGLSAVKSRWNLVIRPTCVHEVSVARRMAKKGGTINDVSTFDWTPVEDSFLLSFITHSLEEGTLLSTAVKGASHELGRSCRACETRYYTLQKKEKTDDNIQTRRINEAT